MRQRRRRKKKYVRQKIYVFAGVLLFFALIALIIPLRPKESAVEKRTLAKFPKPTLETVWNGEFFESMNTWYADTFPFRDWLISRNMKFRSAYGIQKTQIYGSMQASADNTEEKKEKEKKVDTDAEPADEKQDKTLKDGTKQRAIEQIQEQFGAVYLAEDTAFSLFGFSQDVTDDYIEAVNALVNKVDEEEVKIYDMVVPISSGVYLDSKLQKDLGSNDQKEAVQYIYDRLDDKVTTVDVFAALENHNDEYLYFRSDHHWTALGAYYAYCEFMDIQDMKPTPIDSYETMTFDNFLGTMYSYCNQAPALGNNPDSVTAYIPLATNDMQFLDKNGTTMDYKVITDVSGWNSASKYNCFIGSDQPLAWIQNPKKSDGSSCLVVKESYGNAFVPFLVDHYEYVYVVDYRFYPKSLTELIAEKEIKNVLFLNNVMATSTDTLVPSLLALVNL